MSRYCACYPVTCCCAVVLCNTPYIYILSGSTYPVVYAIGSTGGILSSIGLGGSTCYASLLTRYYIHAGNTSTHLLSNTPCTCMASRLLVVCTSLHDVQSTQYIAILATSNRTPNPLTLHALSME